LVGAAGADGSDATVDIEQETGDSETAVMSQKATTDALGGKVDKLGTAPVTTMGHVYTHYGADQGDIPMSEFANEGSVAVRDDMGRLNVEPGVGGNHAVTFAQFESAVSEAAKNAGAYAQSNVLDAAAGAAVLLAVNNSGSAYAFRPPMVLKFTPGAGSQTMTAFGFSEGDAGDWEIDGEPAEDDGQVVFDGTMRLKTLYQYPFSAPTALGDRFVSESAAIDLSPFATLVSLVMGGTN
jgi:hypothetical protein